jgi:hypothetical protein
MCTQPAALGKGESLGSKGKWSLLLSIPAIPSTAELWTQFVLGSTVASVAWAKATGFSGPQLSLM